MEEKHLHTNHPHHDDEIDIHEILQMLWQYRVWALVVGLLCVISGLSYALLSSPVYRSDAMLQVESDNNPYSILQDMPLAKDLLVGENKNENEIILSRRVLGSAVDELNLTTRVQIRHLPWFHRLVESPANPADSYGWLPERYARGGERINIAHFSIPEGSAEQSFLLRADSNGGYDLLSSDDETILEGQVGEDVQKNGYRLLVSRLDAGQGREFTLEKMSRYQAIQDLQENLVVTGGSKNSQDIIRIAMENTDPELAASIVNSVTRHYIQYNIENHTAVTEKTLEFVEGQLKRFSSDVSFNNELYMMLLTKAHELKVMKAGELGNVRIVDRAIVAEKPIKPRKALVVLIAVLLGIFLGVMAALIRSMLDKALYDPNVVETNLNLPVYATIPLSQTQMKLNKRGWQVSNNGNLSQSLLFMEDPDDQAIEAMRFLRTSFESGELHVNKHGIVAITGPSPNVGKTFLSANMACLLSELGHRVLLIDADLRRGQINEYFALENECGLADFLSDTVTVDAVLKYSGMNNLDIITRGGSPENPSVLMSSKQLKILLDEVKQRYDIVIIDTPPALAVTDATIISRHCDKLMLVIRAGLTTMDEVTACWRRLTQSGKKPSGLVMSCYDPSKLGYKKYHQYGYY